MIIAVTNKIGRGELVLETIGWPAKAGTQITLTDDKYNNADIQQALIAGFLEVKTSAISLNVEKKIKVQNTLNKPLAVNEHSIEPGGFAYWTEVEMISQNVVNALGAGYLVIVDGSEDPNKREVDEAISNKAKKTKKTKKKSKKKAKKKAKKTKKKTVKKKPKLLERPAEPETQPGSWNPHTGKLLDAETSRKTAGLEIEGVVPEADDASEVQVGDVDFVKEASKAPVKAAKKKRSSKKKKAASSKKGKKKASKKKTSKSLKPVGRRRPEPRADDVPGIYADGSLPNEGSLSFVDHEQDAERIASNPSLARQNSEIE